MQQLDEVRKAFEDKFTVYPAEKIRPIAVAPTQEPFVEIMVGTGRLGVGFKGDLLCLTPKAAVDLWAEAVERYAFSKMINPPDPDVSKAVLYWRIFPEIDEFTLALAGPDWGSFGKELKIWKVYSRLLISTKPVSDSYEKAE